MTPSLPIIGIKIPTIYILGIMRPNLFAFLGIVIPDLPIACIETTSPFAFPDIMMLVYQL